MKHIVFVLIAFLSFVTCSSDDDNTTTIEPGLIGNWKLVAIYSDPGDGSGDFAAVSSDKTIAFNANGTLNSNANLCLLFSETGESSSGTYSETEGSFTITDCETTPVTAYYELVGVDLIISYFCIEGCQEKYEKIE
jgi:hypothetical protein